MDSHAWSIRRNLAGVLPEQALHWAAAEYITSDPLNVNSGLRLACGDA